MLQLPGKAFIFYFSNWINILNLGPPVIPWSSLLHGLQTQPALPQVPHQEDGQAQQVHERPAPALMKFLSRFGHLWCYKFWFNFHLGGNRLTHTWKSWPSLRRPRSLPTSTSWPTWWSWGLGWCLEYSPSSMYWQQVWAQAHLASMENLTTSSSCLPWWPYAWCCSKPPGGSSSSPASTLVRGQS